jgi:hypothetical protein
MDEETPAEFPLPLVKGGEERNILQKTSLRIFGLKPVPDPL